MEIADSDTGYVQPAPLPVIRLHPEMFDVQPAAADESERVDADDVDADGVAAEAAVSRDTVADVAPPRDLD